MRRPAPATPSSWPGPRSSTASGSSIPTGSCEASGEAVGLPPGQMGNSEVGHLTIGSGRILFQDLQRVNRAIDDGSFAENAALLGAFERARARGGDVHLLGLVSHGGVHSHIDHLQALLELSRRVGMEDRTWVHAFTDGRDVSPTRRGRRSRRAAGRADRDRRRAATTRWIATGAGTEPSARSPRSWAGRASGRNDAVAAVRASYDARGSPTSSSSRWCSTGTPRLDAARRRDLLQLPPRPRTSARREKLLDAGIDVTTMTRYRDDLDCPVAFAEQEGAARRWPRCSPRRRAPAAHGRDREVRPRDLLLQRRRRGRSGRARRGSSSPRRATCRATTRSPRCPRAR